MTADKLTMEELAGDVLEWARTAKPQEYEATMGVKAAGMGRKFNACLRRLTEIRWQDDPDWRLKAPLRLLEETNVVGKFRLPNGVEVEVAGRHAPNVKAGEHRTWGWGELARYIDEGWDIDLIMKAKDLLDLGIQEGQPYPIVEYRPPPPPPKRETPRSTRRRKLAEQANMSINDKTSDDS